MLFNYEFLFGGSVGVVAQSVSAILDGNDLNILDGDNANIEG